MLRLLFSSALLVWVGLSAGAQGMSGWEVDLEAGYAQMAEGKFKSVIAFCEKWRAENNAPPEAEAAFLTLQGNALRRLGRPAEAIPFHEQAMRLRATVFGEPSEEVADCLQNLGNCHWNLADYPNALLFFEKNEAVRRAIFPEKDQRLVLPMMNLGDALFETGQTDEAENFFQKALELEAASGKKEGETAAILRSDLAHCFLRRGLYLRALDSLKIVLSFFQKTHSADILEKGRCHQRIGLCHLEMGDAETARQHFRAALPLFENNPDGLASMHHEMGRLLRYDGDFNGALDHLSKAVTAAEQLPEKSLARPTFLAAIWLQLGNVYFEQKEWDGALFYFEKIVNSGRPIYWTSPPREKTREEGWPNKLGGHRLFAATWLKMGAVREAKKDSIQAEIFYQKALEAAEAGTDKSKTFAALQRLGHLSLGAGKVGEALDFFTTARKQLGDAPGEYFYEKIQAQKSISESLLARAEKSGKRTDWKMAVEAAAEGIRQLSELKGGLRNERAELDVQTDFFQLYNFAVEGCARAGWVADAFHFTEAYRGNLARKLARQHATDETEAAHFSERLAHAEQALAAAQKKRHELAGSSPFALRPQARAEADSLIQKLLATRDKLLDSLAENAPRHFSFWHQKKYLSPADLRQTLTENQTFLEYHWGESSLFVFVFRKDTFLLVPLPVSEGLREEVFSFFHACRQNPAWLPQGSPPELPRLGHKLYEKLVTPVAGWLGEEVIIAPDAWLWYLPFEALLSRPVENEEAYWEYPYWVREKAISYAHSAQLFFQIKNGGEAAEEDGLLAVAPLFEKGTSSYKPLLHNLDEARAASRIMGGECLTAAAADKGNLKQLAPRFPMLLFSTHGVLDDRNAAWSHLALAPEEAGGAHGLLHVWEIYHLRRRAEMVMLSACQTANGRMNRGEGLMSLVRAFHFAGAESVVGSLWNVDDRQTPLLMASFFENLKDGRQKNMALAEAKREYLSSASRLKTHPFFWAGFVFSGDVSEIEGAAGGVSWGWIFAGVLGLALLIWGWRKNQKSHIIHHQS